MSVPTLITFIAYLIILLAIGFCFYRKSSSIEDYLLGGRGMGSWVTVFSAQASDMSGWLLMGLPGAIYLAGMGQVWIAVGLFIGTVLNWMLVSARLRVYTQKTSAITLPCFFEARFKDPTGLLRIVSAIMSTIDSQLLVSSSALSEDFYCRTIKKQASQKEIVLVGRICVIIISIIALFLALDRNNTILGIVAYAWGGFGAAFGPLVLFALFSRKTSWQSAMAGMVTGTVVLVLWKQIDLSDEMYEIVPGFAANCLAILLFNFFIGQKDQRILKEFDEIVAEIKRC
jgi:Na+/proline symporter